MPLNFDKVLPTATGEGLQNINEPTLLQTDKSLNNENINMIVREAAKRANDSLLSCITEEMEEKFLKCIISMEKDYPKNEFLFSVDGVPVITSDDIHTIGAKQKGGKTSLVTILIAAALNGEWNRVKCLCPGMTILYVDTEMKKIDTQKLGSKAAAMGGVKIERVDEKVHLVNFRPLSPQEMETGIRFFIKMYKPKCVIIDGIVDLCSNFNDVEASQNLVLNFLMKIAEEDKCAIINVLHTNKTDNYTELRGHLGAFFEQKGTTVIKCEKDDNSNIVTVSFPTHRYAPVPDFHFGFDEDGIPVSADVQYSEIEAAKQRSKEEQKAAEKEDTYNKRSKIIISILNENGGSMERKALTKEAMNRLEKGRSTVNALLREMKSKPIPSIEEDNNFISALVF